MTYISSSVKSEVRTISQMKTSSPKTENYNLQIDLVKAEIVVNVCRHS